MSEYGLWIGGRQVRTGRVGTVAIPYDGAPFASVHLAGAKELEAAIQAAVRAKPVMRSMTAAGRSDILYRACRLLTERKEEFGRTVASESGKPLREGLLEAERSAQTLLFSAEQAHALTGEVVPMDASEAGAGRMAMTVREPVGAIAAITPFNFPLNLSLHKIAPAIAGGNTVVHKPASATPVCALLLARLFAEAGLPDGALNVVPGPGAEIGDPLVDDPRIAMVTFTGSAEVGLRIRQRAGLKKVTLELGNNSALIVHDDADLAECAARAVPGAFAHSGQVCISIQRILVHRTVAEDFIARFLKITDALKIGHPLDPSTQVSSLITATEASRAERWIRFAEAGGARLLAGGVRRGATLTPAVLDGVAAEADIWRSEAFAPVACFRTYETLDEAISLMNASPYGLQAGIFTRGLQSAFEVACQAKVGGFLINDVPQYRLDHMPYGGVKLSGMGREGPKYAIEEMTEPKLISWRWK
ncbi:MAG TPA: aldehyde dehydrogenase family protein [Bryobacteraceae bacterium]|nr:aldehyde dehydrogenase family protein [Bryobacteraceae bacterium]